MAAKNRANGPDINGTEQQKTDLFQNLEKLIASAVSICRLDGSVQCQIGGLITVIEELQRLLRHSFAEINRLERNIEDQKRNLEDQEHTFTNTVSNLHYEVKAVQSSVETLKHESEEAQKSKEKSSADQRNSPNATGVEQPQISLVDECYGEESDGSIPNNLVQKTGDNPVIPNILEDNTLTDTAGDTSVGMESSSNNLEDNTLTDTAGDTSVGMETLESSSNNLEDNTLTDTAGDTSVGMETFETSSNNLEDNTLTDTGGDASVGSSQPNEESTRPDPNKEDDTDDNGEQEATTDKATTPPPAETLSTNAPDSMLETATSTTEERETALRSLRSISSSKPDTSPSQDEERSPRRNHHLKNRARSLEVEAGTNRTILSLRNHGRSPLGITNSKSPSRRTSSHNTRPQNASLSRQLLVRNAAKHKVTPPGKPARKIQPSPQKHIAPKRSSLSPSKLKRLKLLVKSPQRQKELSKVQRKAQASVKQSRKSLAGGSIKNPKIIAKSPTKHSPLKTRNGARLSISPAKRKQVLNVSNTKASTATASRSFPKETKKASTQQPIPSEENLMDKYINLDFLINANQLMSELVSDSDREEGTLDTASEVERRYIVDLAKLYRLRVRMADKCDGDLPVALIKGRESSLPETGQVDRLLYTMTHAMAIKTKSANKHKLSKTGNRRSMASPTKKRRV